jgi:hypothetical protein
MKVCDIHICIHHIHSQFIVVSFGFFNIMKIKKTKNRRICMYVCVRVCDKEKEDIKEKTKTKLARQPPQINKLKSTP